MNKVRKIRFYPNKSQINLINKILGGCRYVSNLYIEYEKKYYESNGEFLSGYDFAKIITKLKKSSIEYMWLNGISTKALKDSIMNTEKSFKNFFKKNGGYPHFKSRKRMTKESFFFIRDHIHFNTDFKNIIKIPILGKIRITERNYLPNEDSITSGRVIKDRDKYYVIFIYNTSIKPITTNDFGIGCDIGVKTYLTCYDGKNAMQFKHFKDDTKYKKLHERIIKLQQIISHKVEVNYFRKLNNYLDTHNGEEPNDIIKNMMKGESYNTSCIRRLKRKISNLYETMCNIRKDYIYKLVHILVVRTKPRFITIENLSISNMIQGEGMHDLHRYIQESGFYYFKTHLADKISEYGWSTELRIADKYFASSKKCNHCGNKLKTLSLSDRIYSCPECGFMVDRDVNAAMNLYDLKKYTIYA